MNRTDRLYALVEELRAVSPRPRSARWLAERFEVSTRTIERDLLALQESGLPIWAEPGRTGGYVIDRALTLPPLTFTADEAFAALVGLAALERGPFRQAARSAVRKLVAAMPQAEADRANDLASRVLLLEPDTAPSAPVPAELGPMLRAGQVLRLGYRDRDGAPSTREVEPLGHVVKDGDWYLLAWCRLRDGIRAFRLDRIERAEPTGEQVAPRPLRREDVQIVLGTLRRVVPER